MNNTIQFRYDAIEDIAYEESEGHYYLHIPAFFTLNSYANRRINFILDTGAYLTVISRHTAIRFGFDKLSPIHSDINLSGFAGTCKGDLIETPGLIIGGKILEGVRVAIPKATEGMNILGLNVLEYFNYLIDSTNSKIYFARNENYKIPKELEEDITYEATDEPKIKRTHNEHE
jgi:predicted aspartyl protease